MGNQKLKRVYVFDRQRLMNADQKFKREWERKMEKMILFFQLLVPFFSQFNETKASFDSQRRRMLTRDEVVRHPRPPFVRALRLDV